jgi:beta-phosphoglucomutase
MIDMVEAVIFDLDGVITDTAEYHYLAWKALADELEIPFDRRLNERLKGISRMESLELILTSGGMGKRFSSVEKEKLAAKKNQYYLQLIAHITPQDILPGIASLIQEIKRHGLKIGLASASKNASAVLDSLELTSQFDVVVDASKITKGKPDPEIFLTAAHALGVPPRNCIGIEDAASGIEAIRAAGMFAVGVGDAGTLSRAHYIVDSTSKLNFKEILNAFEHVTG